MYPQAADVIPCVLMVPAILQESTLYPHCAVTKGVEDDAMACFMAHAHALCSSVSGHVASSAGVASAAVTAVAVVQGPIRPAGPQYNVT